MATITVRGLDDDVVRALKMSAAREGRSMEAEIRSILTAAARRASSPPPRVGEGFGTRLASIFSDGTALEVPPRDDYPRPLDLT
ncbi:FitA-like ribbon-helix-helix domain-containing protein [Microbacterium sp. XT11]|uniref:FitA-like ribbon-helix-helix domain-containing protein n=1 Tax=Microbacterium sp. XT11 TaxID=367477 RepID=UPI000742DA9C|nr:hypothetical protein [Microbacterium sp. XT11]ALX66130.1 putative plasmid stability-like protein [Microbacterium sp. XT11]